jgi:hypothetical protein
LRGAADITAERWRENWRVLSNGDAVRIELTGGTSGEAESRVRQLTAGTPVVLAASGPTASRRCRAFAARAGVDLEREFLAIPNAKAPGCLVEDAPGSIATFLRSVLVAPQGSRLSPLLDAGLAVLRTVASRRIVRTAVPGRIVVGTRT